MAGPKFSDLGVVDPSTGKKVFLSAGEISTVMGATGGVAPTQFQAATEGVFKGIETGQNIYQNAQAAKSNSLTIEAQEIQNEIARRTQDATILAKNNQTQQQAIQAQIQTEKLTADNAVLQAVRSADPQKLTDVISNPQTRLSAIENDQYIQSTFNTINANGGFTPQQLTKFEAYNKTRDIYKQGPIQQEYQTAAGTATGTLAFQQLQGMTGLPTDELLQGMKVIQDPLPLGSGLGTQTKLMAPDGSKVLVDDKEFGALGGFFSAKDKLRTGGTFKLPLGNEAPPASTGQKDASGAATQSTGASPAAAGAQSAPGPVLPGQGAAAPNIPSASATPGQVVSEGAPQVTSSSTPQGAPTNPNNMSPVGLPLQTAIPEATPLNTASTVKGDSVQANTMRKVWAAIAQSGGMLTIKDVYAQASQQAIAEAKVDDKTLAIEAEHNDAIGRRQGMSQEIRRLVIQANKAGVELGPTWADSLKREKQSVVEGVNSLTGDEENLKEIGSVYNGFLDLQSRYKSTVIATSGESKRSGDSDFELKIMLNQSPNYTMTEDHLLAIADRIDAESNYLKDSTYLNRFFNVMQVPGDKRSAYLDEYYQQSKPYVFDPELNDYVPNKGRKSAVEFGNEKLGIDTNAAQKEMVQVPVQKPRTGQETPTPAMGSGTATPFADAKKQNVGFFPEAQNSNPMQRGAGYDSTPASLKDLHAIADTAKSGGDIRQFQTAGTLPRKLDKATPDMMARLVGAESSGNINAESGTGVQGLAQVTKGTFNEQRPLAEKEFGGVISTDRTDPRSSLVTGTSYVNKMLKQFDGNVDFALAAYNAGPGAVESAIKQAKTNNARGTIDQIAPYLPTSQDTGAYVKKITSRGRVGGGVQMASATNDEAPPQQAEKGFFDNNVINELNPFAASTAEAEEPTPTPKETPDRQKLIDEGVLDSKGQMNIDIKGTADSPAKDPGAYPTTESVKEVPKLEPAPRNDVPPVSEIQAALKDTQEDMDIAGSAMPALGAATKFIRNSALGKFIKENITDKDSTLGTAFASGENFVNAATFGLYDEGMNAFDSSMGFDGKVVQEEIRGSLKEFRREHPKLAIASDIIGSVAGGSGSTIMLRALKGVNAARTASTVGGTIAPMTVKEGVKIGASQGAARGFGEGENAGQRLVGAGQGAALGTGLGAAGAKFPVAAAGAAAGAIYEGAKGGSLADVVEGAGIGAVALKMIQKTPALQKLIVKTVTKLNNYEGLKTIGTMFQKLMTGKTPAETAANLSGAESLAAAEMGHLSDAELRAIVKELTQSKNPQIPQRLFDLLKDGDINNIIKVLGQMRGNKEVQMKLNKFLSDRMAQQGSRIEKQLGPEDLVQQSSQKIVNAVNSAKESAKQKAMSKAAPLYAKAESGGFTKSKTLDGLLTTDVMKKAVREASEEINSVKQKAPTNKLIEDLSDELAARVKAGESVDDIIEEFHADFSEDVDPKTADAIVKDLLNPDVSNLSDNSFKVLQRAWQKVRDQIDELRADGKREYAMEINDNIFKPLTAELNKNKAFEKANLEYAVQMGKVDALKDNKLMAQIGDLADGNFEQALPKIFAMPESTLKEFMSVVGDKEAFKEVAKGFLMKRLQSARGAGDVASKLISKDEYRSLEIMLGKQEAKTLKDMVDAESRVARTGRSVGGGSDTAPKAQAAQKIDEMTGQQEAPTIGTQTASALSGGLKSMAGKLVDKVISFFRPGGDPKLVTELADILVLNAQKGPEAINKILKARGLTKAEIKAMEPYLAEFQAAAQGAQQAPGASVTGMVNANTNTKKKKKKS